MALLLALVAVALCVRAVIGVWANGRGEMEGLAYRYEHDAYAIAAGYGFVRPFEGAPPQVELLAYEDSLEERGERIAPSNAPAIEPSRWRPSTLHPPGYAGFLAAVYRVLGNPLIPWAKAVQGAGWRIRYRADATVHHVHDETRSQTRNRYQREAITFQRVFPEEHFNLVDFFRLTGRNVVADWRAAKNQGVLLRNGLSIVGFRVAQFWGTYRGFHTRWPSSSELKRRFYYPGDE